MAGDRSAPHRDWRGIVVPVALLTAWVAIVGPHGPGRLAGAFASAVANGELPAAAAMSFARLAAGFPLGAVAGLATGLVLGFSPLAGRVGTPSFQGLRQVALFAWIPLLTAWLGNGDATKVALVALAAFFPTALHAYRGVRGVPEAYREVGRALELGRRLTAFRILLPAAAPAIVAGLRTALVGAWIGTIGAEYLIGTGSGLGVFLAAARERGRMDRVLAAMALLALIGLGLDLALRRLRGGGPRPPTGRC